MRRAIELAARRGPARSGAAADASGGAEPEPEGARPMILMIDNYDSFTFNLVQALQAAGAEVRVVRNDAMTRADVEAMADDEAADLRGIVVSPGPGDPERAGVSVDTIKVAADRADPAARRVPRHAVDGAPRTARRSSARRRSSTARRPRSSHDGEGLLDGMPADVPGRALPLAVRRPGHAPGRAVRDRDQPRGRRRHGPAPPVAADGGRPVPPRVRADARRPAPAGELPPARRARARRPGSTRCRARSRPAAWPSASPSPDGADGDGAGGCRAMSDQVRAALAAIVDGPHAVDGRGAAAMGEVMDGEATPVAARGAADGPADARRDGRRAGGLRDRDARAGRAGGGARGHDRRRRHRRRRLGHVQHLDDVGARRRRERRARSPSTATAR